MPGLLLLFQQERWWWQGNHHHLPNYHLTWIYQPARPANTCQGFQLLSMRRLRGAVHTGTHRAGNPHQNSCRHRRGGDIRAGHGCRRFFRRALGDVCLCLGRRNRLWGPCGERRKEVLIDHVVASFPKKGRDRWPPFSSLSGINSYRSFGVRPISTTNQTTPAPSKISASSLVGT